MAKAAAVELSPRRVDVSGMSAAVNLQTMGGRMAWARIRRGLTQAEVAKKMAKSRVTITQYERDNILPPLPEIVKMADAIGTTPEYLAFGVKGAVTRGNADEEIVTVNEVVENHGVLSGDGVSYALPRQMFEGKGVDPRKVRMFRLGHPEAEFDHAQDDRLILDTSVKEIDRKHDLYLADMAGGVSVIRRESFVGRKGEVKITTGSGEQHVMQAEDVPVFAAVIGKIELSA